MKDLQPALRAFLLADPELSAAVGGGRIYSITFPQGMTEPSVLMTRISGLGEFHLQGPSGLNRNRVQLGNWARSVSDACELARLVKTRLNGHAGPMGTGETAVKVLSALYDSEREIYDDVTGLYGVTHDYLIMFDELGAAPTVPASTGAFARTEAPDILASLGRLDISATLARMETADALASTARLAIAGTLAQAEATDALTATGSSAVLPLIGGTLAQTEGPDALSSTATIVQPTIGGTLAQTEGADTLGAYASTTADVPDAPVIAISSAATDTTPDFSVDMPFDYGDYRDAAVGDVLVIRKNTNPATSWTTYASRTLTSGDIAGTPLALTGITPMTDGAYLFDSHFERGGSSSLVSNQVAHTISSVFNPASLFASGEKGFWIDFTDIGTLYRTTDTSSPVTISTHKIGRAEDKSGNANHFTQATDLNRLQYVVTSGRASAWGNGNSNVNLSCAGINLNSATDVTVCMGIELRRNSASGAFYEVGGVAANGQPSLRATLSFSSPNLVMRVNTIASTNSNQKWSDTNLPEYVSGDNTYVPLVFTAEHRMGGTGNLNTLRKNGVSIDLAETVNQVLAADFGTSRSGFINTVSPGTSGVTTQRFQSILVINRLLTGAERSGLEAWMAAKSGVTLP